MTFTEILTQEQALKDSRAEMQAAIHALLDECLTKDEESPTGYSLRWLDDDPDYDRRDDDDEEILVSRGVLQRLKAVVGR
jgi:hypothetical protein